MVFLVICHFIIGQLGNISGIVYLPIAYDMLPVSGHVSTMLDFFLKYLLFCWTSHRYTCNRVPSTFISDMCLAQTC